MILQGIGAKTEINSGGVNGIDVDIFGDQIAKRGLVNAAVDDFLKNKPRVLRYQ